MSTASPNMAQVLADAASRRRSTTGIGDSGADLMHEHEKRQKFRRLIDPGIFRPNSRDIAMNALKTLSTIAENVLHEPDNPKYHSFKSENDVIKRRLIQPRGALEYALELGFRPKVIEFQSYYVFDPCRMADLRIGAAMLRETLDRETNKEARERQTKEEQKAVAAAATRNVMLAFMDDRKTKTMRDEIERASREARMEAGRAAGTTGAMSAERDQGPIAIPPGVGHMLSEAVADDIDQPPPYNG